MANFDDLKEIRQDEPEKNKVVNTLTETPPEKLGNKGWKIFFACFAVLFLVGWELAREFTYLSAKIILFPKYL